MFVKIICYNIPVVFRLAVSFDSVYLHMAVRQVIKGILEEY